MDKKLVFIIEGEPISAKSIKKGPHMWSETIQRQHNFEMNLANQLEKQTNSENKITDNIELILQFFLAPKPLRRLDNVYLTPHTDLPKLIELQKFVEFTLMRNILSKDARITKVTAEKYFDNHQRTIIKMTTKGE